MCLFAMCTSSWMECPFKELTHFHGFKMCQIVHVSLSDFPPELQIGMPVLQMPPDLSREAPSRCDFSMSKAKSPNPQQSWASPAEELPLRGVTFCSTLFQVLYIF